MTFPYKLEDPTGPFRTCEQYWQNAADAVLSGSPVGGFNYIYIYIVIIIPAVNFFFLLCTTCTIQVHGIKGPSWLATIPQFNIIEALSFDYMHIVCLGIVRLVLHLWFDSTHSKQPWYLRCHIKEIDRMLCAITPPDEILRAPRSIEGTLKYWKGIYRVSALFIHMYVPRIYASRCVFNLYIFFYVL